MEKEVQSQIEILRGALDRLTEWACEPNEHLAIIDAGQKVDDIETAFKQAIPKD
jgi:hypothetical protein